MTHTHDILALLIAAGVAPGDTEQLVIVMPRPATAEAMDALTLTLRELQGPSSEVLGQPGCGFSGGLASSGLEI